MLIKSIVYFLLLKGLVYGEVVLSPSSPGTTENSSLILTCTYTGDESVTYFTWKKMKKNETLFTNVGVVSSECTPVLLPIDPTVYGYDCPTSKKYTWTIKEVSRQNAGERYQCAVDTPSPGVIGSNDVIISVRVQITFVELVTPNSSTVTVKEEVETEFKCKTSGGLPKATITWYKSGGISNQSGNEVAIVSQIHQSSSIINGLDVVTSILRYLPSRSENGWRIYCKASNIDGQTPVVSRKPQMEVLYPPNPPVIIGFNDVAEYRVIANTQGNLLCSITGGNPAPVLSWDCYNIGTSEAASAGTVTIRQTWIAERGKDKTCTCNSFHYSGNESLSISIVVLYPPSVPRFEIQGTIVNDIVKVIQNNTLSISCISLGKPPPSYIWTYPSSSNILGQVLTLNNVQSDKRLTCDVQNTMNPTGGGNVRSSNSSHTDVKVLYPPSTPLFNYWTTSGQSIPTRSLDVIKGDTFKVACTSTGKPSPAYYWDNHGNNRILTITKIDPDKTSSVCKAESTMTETVGQTLTRSATASLYINVQYPPTALMLKYSNGDTLSNTLSVREGNGFNVICNSTSNPLPSYNWTGTVSSTSSILNVNKAVKSYTGTITCNVANVMIRTFANPEKKKIVKIDKSLDLQILYPPTIGELTNKSVVEGSSLRFPCPVTVGNPNKTTYQWIRDGAVWRKSPHFSIETLTRTDAMTYTCKVSNTMVATGENPVSLNVTKSFYLNVWYNATVKDFYIFGHQGQTSVVKSEGDRLQFNCTVDSNPEASMTLTYMEEVLQAKTDVKQLTHTIESATCTMRGNYVCEGFNKYNKNDSFKTIHLFVKCSPRPSPFTSLNENVTSAQHIPAVLTFTTLAYPETLEFKWFRWYNNLWQQISDNEEFQIDTLNIQSNLTIKYVNKTHFGKYQLQVKNRIGNYTQPFYLEAEDIPETPLEFQHIQEKVTESSITVQWIPGFDNGPDQTFVLKYKKSSGNEWMVIHIRDTGEKKMNYTLTSLSSGTLYELVLYASNSLGNSSETGILIIETKSEDEGPRNLGLIIGSVCGGLACAVLVILGFLFVRKFRNRTGQGKSNANKNERKRVYADDDNDYGMQDNPMYVSAGPRDEASRVSGEAGLVYSSVDKKQLVPDSSKNEVYAEVNKPKKAKPINVKKEKPVKGKHGFKKDIIAKEAVQDGDIYENATTADTKTKSKSNDETIYENPEPSNSKKNVNRDGLIYADLTFNDQSKGQKKLVIHGLDSMTEYVEVDFTKKADPLPDSDDENVPPK